MEIPRSMMNSSLQRTMFRQHASKLRTRYARSITTHTHSFHANQISILQSKADTTSTEFKQNAKQMEEVIQRLRELQAKISLGGSTKARDKHVARGKMLVRDRITALVDPSTPFLELSPLAGHEMYSDIIPSGGVVTGIGTINGTTCMIVANDATVKGGTYYPITVKKHLRAQEIAQQNRLPCVYLVDSGGANLPHQKDVFPDREHFGRIFYNQARMSSLGIPQISVVMGPCTAGGAYVPSMSDESIIVAGQGHIYLAGPPLVKAATGEIVSAEDLGGGQMHCSESGVTDYLAVDDAHALVIARRCISNLNYPRNTSISPSLIKATYAPPLYDPAELNGLIPSSLRTQIPAHEVIARIVDGSEFSEFKPLFGQTLVTGFAKIQGQQVGILASNGILFSPAALKGAHFIQLCTGRNIPLLFLQNISGFMVGKDAEAGGIAKNGAKLVTAVACANVPKLTVVFGASYGAGNYGMCGRSYSPRFLWTWPNSKTGVMGPEQLVSVMKEVGGTDESLQSRIEKETEAEFGSARLWDDGIIEPKLTRDYVGLGLRAALSGWGEKEKTRFGVFRM